MSTTDNTAAAPVAVGWACPGCGGVHGPHIDTCPRSSVYVPPSPFDPSPVRPVERCAFDGLEPGFYGLVCSCPKCTTR